MLLVSELLYLLECFKDEIMKVLSSSNAALIYRLSNIIPRTREQES